MTTLDIAIVTSCHNYGRYLLEWAQSIVALSTYYPTIVAIVDNGSTDTTPHDVDAAADLLTSVGIDVVTERIPFGDFGTARNRAVEISGGSEWVMHLDADDTLMAHFLEDVAEIMPTADVVGAGYQRTGDLKSGPRNKTRIYSSHQGASTLRSNAPCSGVSPFRRLFWERSPYRTDMRGGWDTALWIGFAHLNARFVPTRRPVFCYRQHADSIFNMRRTNDQRTSLVGVKLGALRRKVDSGVSVLVPFRPDGAERDAAFDWVRRRYEALHPEWEFLVGACPDAQPWKKGVAVAEALVRAKGATLVITDADVVIEPRALSEAVDLVERRAAEWVVPHRLVKRLDQPSTDLILDGDPSDGTRGPRKLRRASYEGYAGGGIVVITRSDYEASGGIPTAFAGWGAEDECLAIILDTLLGPHTRLGYDLWHLYHSPVRRMRHVSYKQNRALLQLYAERVANPDLMWELIRHIDEGGDPTNLPDSGRVGGVAMVAIEEFSLGTRRLEIGEVFRCSEEEARRHDMRPRKMARRMNGSLLATRQTAKERTLDIRAEQAERNAKANAELAQRQQELIRRGG